MKAFFWLLSVVGIFIAGAYYFLFTKNSAAGVQIVFKGPEKIVYGTPFELKVGVGNSSTAVWKNAALSLSLPKGFVFVGGSSGVGFMVRQVGDVGIGSFTEIPFTIMAVPELEADEEENAVDSTLPDSGAVGGGSDEAPAVPIHPRTFQAQLSYAQAGSSAVFERTEEWSSPTIESGFNVSITAPEKAASGEEIEIVIAYANTTDSYLDDLVVTASYPDSFIFTSASTEPDKGKNVWNIGGLKKGSSDSLAIKGRITASGTAQLRVSVTRRSGSLKYPIANNKTSVAVEAPPLSLMMDVNDQPDYAAHLGDTLAYTLSYTMEDMRTTPKGLQITADLLSPLFDVATIVLADGGVLGRGPNGVPRISWYVAKPETEGGSVGFSIKVKNDYGIRRLGDRNFILEVRGEAEVNGVVGTINYQTKVVGNADVSARAYFRDAESGIVNKGVLPPKVGNRTEYTVRWKLINYATDVRGVIVRAKLPQGVSFTSVVKSNVDSKPIYDVATREIVWRLDRISATTGLLSTAPEAIFQIASIPDASMKGKNAPLLGVTDMTATDDFTGVGIRASVPEITTALPDDATATGQGIVE